MNGSIGFTSLFKGTRPPGREPAAALERAGVAVAVQIIAQFGDEATIFRLAAQIETTRPWKDRRPPWMA